MDERRRTNDEGQRKNPNSQLPKPKSQPPTTNDQQPATNRQRPVLRLLGLLAFLIGAVLLIKPLLGPPKPPNGNPQALAWLAESDAAMNALTSVTLLRTTRGDSGGVLTETMTFAAPDLFYSEVSSYSPTFGNNSSETLTSGARQYYRGAGESLWQAVNRTEPFRFPDFYLGGRAIYAKLAGVEEVQGKQAQRVTYTAYEGPRAFAFTRWIDVETKLILQEYMDAPGHHMLSVYEAYNAPVTITPPSPAEVGPTPTVVIPY
jgi:hypothetical protein